MKKIMKFKIRLIFFIFVSIFFGLSFSFAESGFNCNAKTACTTGINNVNVFKVLQSRLSWHNKERNNVGLSGYAYNLNLQKTANIWANEINVNLSGKVTHVRKITDGYYNYKSINEWFKNNGVQLTGVGTLFSESLGRGYYKCNKSDCTDTLIKAIKTSFDFFMSEKGKKSAPHYNGIVSKNFKLIGLGIA
ncbi:MAG: hypothetical protein WC872_04880, partial [Candidatus Absconditabacterales bacterium]